VVGERISRFWLRLVVGASAVMALALFVGGCGGESENRGGESEAKAQMTSFRPAPLDKREAGQIKPVRWSAVAERRRALRLGVQVPYCGYREPVPFIKRVERRRGPNGLVFTVFVRFGPEHLEPGGCVGEELILGKWVRIGDKARSKPLFDGSTSPPSRRQLPP
jgi:hypothetical protein